MLFLIQKIFFASQQLYNHKNIKYICCFQNNSCLLLVMSHEKLNIFLTNLIQIYINSLKKPKPEINTQTKHQINNIF